MTDYTATPSNAQTIINGLTPGDSVTLSAGTYGTLNVGVSGTLNNPIVIRGAGFGDDGGPQVTVGALTVTGSYLSFYLFLIRDGSTGVLVTGSQHVAFANINIRGVSGVGFRARGNARYIYLDNVFVGEFNPPTTGLASAFRVGTPSGSWTGGVPDDTSFVTFRRCHGHGVFGDTFVFYEGAHHITLWGCGANHDDDRYQAGDPYKAFVTSANDVQLEFCASLAAPLYAFHHTVKTISGRKWGVNTHVYRSRMRLQGSRNLANNLGAGIASNASTELSVWGGSASIDANSGPALKAVDGGTWVNPVQVRDAPGSFPPEDYDRLEWGSAADDYAPGYPEGPNEFGLHRHFTGISPTVLASYIANPNREAVEIAWLGEGVEFYHSEEDRQVRVTKIGYFRSHSQQQAQYGAVFDQHTGQIVPNSFTQLRTPPTPFQWGWEHTELPIETPAVLVPHRHYRVVVWTPAGKVGQWLAAPQVDTLGFFPQPFYRNYEGVEGFEHHIVRVPPTPQCVLRQVTGLSHIWRATPDDNPNKVPSTESVRETQVFMRKAQSGDAAFAPDGCPPPNPPDMFLGDDGFIWIHDILTLGLIPGPLLVDAIVGYYREPEETTAQPDNASGLQALVNNLIPGDVLTISGTHRLKETLSVRVSGTSSRPITIRGDGTAVLQGFFGADTCYDGVRLHEAKYIKLDNIIVERFGRGLVLEEAEHVKVKDVTCRHTRGAGHSCQDASRNVYYQACTAHDTGSDLNTGDGFRCGTLPNRWPLGDTVRELTTQVRYDQCTAYRTLGDGFDIHTGAELVVLKNCSVDHTMGNTPAANQVAGTAGFHSRADKVQFIDCTVVGAPKAGYECFDVLWSGVTYGRGQQVKAGSSTSHGQGGVVSQSDDMRVYSDFTATAPRVVEVEGGWVAAGSNVNPSGFSEHVWASPAASY